MIAKPSAPHFRPVEYTRRSGRVVEQFRELIATGKLQPGDRLPSERDLVRILVVGRTTVREALRLLESLGLLEVRPGEGTFLTTDDVPLALHTRPVMNSTLQQHILEARLVLEPQIAALAAQRATDADLQMLRSILHMQGDQVAAAQPGTWADVGFHAALCLVARNPILKHFRNSVRDTLRDSRRSPSQAEGRPSWSVRDHGRIFRAIEAHNPALARQRMTRHIESLWQWIGEVPPSGTEN